MCVSVENWHDFPVGLVSVCACAHLNLNPARDVPFAFSVKGGGAS